MGVLQKSKRFFGPSEFVLYLVFLLMCFVSSVFAAPRATRLREPAPCSSPHPFSPIADFGADQMAPTSGSLSMLLGDRYGQAQVKLLGWLAEGIERPIQRMYPTIRPCGCPDSFPSGHMIRISWPASYLYHRYGWQYGLPAYASSLFFANDRHNAKSHYWSDLIGTAVLMHGIAYLTVTPYEPNVRQFDPYQRFRFMVTRRSFAVSIDLHKPKPV